VNTVGKRSRQDHKSTRFSACNSISAPGRAKARSGLSPFAASYFAKAIHKCVVPAFEVRDSALQTGDAPRVAGAALPGGQLTLRWSSMDGGSVPTQPHRMRRSETAVGTDESRRAAR
jgi:hypothetical protein